jgi:pyruvate dehydrogenase E2 component (dihydrolipoamide acetyltransferase)
MQLTLTQKDMIFHSFQAHKFSSNRMVPTVTMTINIDLSQLLKLKNAVNAGKKVPHITLTHLVIKAVADTLVKFPILYSFFDGKKIIPNPELVVNIPVDIENHVEYITIHSPELKNITVISQECLHELEQIHNDKGQFYQFLLQMHRASFMTKLTHLLSSNGTIEFLRRHYGNFPISNFGSFQIDNGSLALSQPMIAGLCIGALKPVTVRKNTEFTEVMNLPLTLSFDHRVLDGAYGGKFLNEVKILLEHPDTILMI